MAESIVNAPEDISSGTPAGVDPTQVEVRFAEFYNHVVAPELIEFCASLGWSCCHNVTAGALNSLQYVSGIMSMIIELANTFENIMGVITPDFNISLVTVDEVDSNPMQSGFLELSRGA